MSSMSSTRTLAMTWSRAEAGSAPGWLKTRMPARKTIRVGMDVIPAEPANDCSVSVSTLPNTMSGWAALAFSKVGPNARHGPHQAAHQSTRTMSLSSRVCSKDAAVSACVVMRAPSRFCWIIPQGVLTAQEATAFLTSPTAAVGGCDWVDHPDLLRFPGWSDMG